jgi:multiple sugar transport system permease protein
MSMNEPASGPMGSEKRRRPALELRSRVARQLVALPVAAVFLLPLWLMVVASLRPLGTAPIALQWFPSSPAWGNFAEVFDVVPLARYAVNSLLVGRVSVFRWLGLTDTPIPLMAPALLGTSPLFVLLYAWTTSRLPKDLFDLARERGLSPVSTWRRVAMPLQRGTTAAVASLAFVLTWGNFLDPLIYLYDERWFTLPLGMRSLAIMPVTDQPLMLAAAVIACVPVVLGFAIAQRRLFADPGLGDST